MLSMNQICRLCLRNTAFYDIFTNNPNLLKTVEICTNLRMNPDDCLPSNICKLCVRFIERIIDFKEKCENSDKFLRTKLNSDYNVDQEIDVEEKLNTEHTFAYENSLMYPEIIVTECEFDTGTINESNFDFDPIELNEKHYKKDDSEIFNVTNIKKDFENRGKKANVKKNDSINKKIENICPFCGISFESVPKWAKHLRTHVNKPFECDICKYQYKTKRFLSNHIKKHSDLGFTEYCIKKSESKRISLTADKNNSSFSDFCPYCGLRSHLLADWEKHLRTHKTKPLECDMCNKSYLTKRHLIAHINKHSKKRGCQCDFCGGIFRTHYRVQRHISEVHSFTPVNCKVCGKLVKSTAIKAHMLTHNGEKKYQCEHCERRFLTKVSLEGHVRTHTGEKPFRCRFCSSSFAHRRTKDDHERLHTGERPYNCPACELGFIQLSNMKSHFRNNHKGVAFVYKKKNTSL